MDSVMKISSEVIGVRAPSPKWLEKSCTSGVSIQMFKSVCDRILLLRKDGYGVIMQTHNSMCATEFNTFKGHFVAFNMCLPILNYIYHKLKVWYRKLFFNSTYR